MDHAWLAMLTIHIQGQKLNGSILKYGKLAYFQSLVNLYFTHGYNAIPAL